MSHKITTYAQPRNTSRHANEEVSYLSKDFNLGILSHEDAWDDNSILIMKNLEFPYVSRRKMIEFANLLEAFALGLWHNGEEIKTLECLLMADVLVDDFPTLKCELHYTKTYGEKVLTKDVFLSKAECYSLAKNIRYYIEESTSAGRPLVFSS